jgi:hypothetical protein
VLRVRCLGAPAIHDVDASACGLSAARLLVNANDEPVTFPDDFSSCDDAEDAIGDAARDKALWLELNRAAAAAETLVDIAPLPGKAFAKNTASDH